MTWERRYLAVEAGDVGGDVQVTSAYETTWSRRLAGGLFGLITRRYYGAVHMRAYYELPIAPELLQCQTEYLVCRDPANAGDTEVTSDLTYQELPAGDAEAARNAAEAAHEPNDAEWLAQMPLYPAAE